MFNVIFRIKKRIKSNSFVYFDPPYRPINKTSSFISYSKEVFDDKAQGKLSELINRICSDKNIKIMLSNSDPKNENIEDDFFERLYPKSKFMIVSLKARRLINCNAQKRGLISELLITNY